jgi:hypothetical protein
VRLETPGLSSQSWSSGRSTIGAGHLAKAGIEVCALERHGLIGGAACEHARDAGRTAQAKVDRGVPINEASLGGS